MEAPVGKLLTAGFAIIVVSGADAGAFDVDFADA